MEIANGFSELTNPKISAAVSKANSKSASEGTKKPTRWTKTTSARLSYGIASGGPVGRWGIDRLAMLLTDSHTIAMWILFPAYCGRKSTDPGGHRCKIPTSFHPRMAPPAKVTVILNCELLGQTIVLSPKLAHFLVGQGDHSAVR